MKNSFKIKSEKQNKGAHNVSRSTTRLVFFPIFGRYFHSPTDTKELLYDPASVMNGDTLKFCQKEAWCKMSFFVLSFFYYLYW